MAMDSNTSSVLDSFENFRLDRGFQYQALPHTDSIRLVKLCSNDPQVTCEIKTVRLSENPEYNALSYCWGTSVQDARIICNDALFRVSPNLRDGMRQLYHYSEREGVEWFWIDQICIDQEDGKERTQQVRLMKDIYQQSIKTLIWLPLDDEIARDLRTIIFDICTCWLICGPSPEPRVPFPCGQLPKPNDKRWKSLHKALSSPWFSRVWAEHLSDAAAFVLNFADSTQVIQEVALSPSSPMMLCGRQFLDWSIFGPALNWLTDVYVQEETNFREAGGHAFNVVSIANGLKSKESWKTNPWDLTSLLQMTQINQATDPRDRIFSLLGIAQETRDSNLWPSELTPDYNRTIPKLYAEVTRYCISQGNSLRLLSHVRPELQSDTEYPSWVPRLDMGEVQGFVQSYATVMNSDGITTLERLFYDASRNYCLMLDKKTTPSVLRIRGIGIGPAIHCLQKITMDDAICREGPDGGPVWKDGFLKGMLLLLMDCGTHLPHMSTSEVLQAFFLVTTTGLTPDCTDAHHEPLIHFEAFLHEYSERIEADETMSLNVKAAVKATMSTSSSMPLASGPADASTVSKWRYVNRLRNLLNHRLFITESERLGLGPMDMAENDVVVVLFGGTFPFVLRPLENQQWKLIGECYVHGIMKGEALEDEGANESNHEWFEIV